MINYWFDVVFDLRKLNTKPMIIVFISYGE